MADDFLGKAEEEELFRQKQKDSSGRIFDTAGSSGANPIRLAQILSVFDLNMALLGWQDKPLAKLTTFLTQYQGSIDARYHNDFKEIKIAEEIERRRSERKGISILQQ